MSKQPTKNSEVLGAGEGQTCKVAFRLFPRALVFTGESSRTAGSAGSRGQRVLYRMLGDHWWRGLCQLRFDLDF